MYACACMPACTHDDHCLCPLRAPTLPEEDAEHVDAEQLEIETRCTDPDLKPDPHGVGYQLRAYWNATVQEAVEVRFNSVRAMRPGMHSTMTSHHHCMLCTRYPTLP